MAETGLLHRIATVLRHNLPRWIQRARDRRLLAWLDDRRLREMGLDRYPPDQRDTTWTWPLR